MVFWCFPSRSKYEWADLRGFVAQYNAINGTAYERVACLDVETRDRKAPELLLESPGEIPMVIERKSVVWPRDYLSDHGNEHPLYALRPDALDGVFVDAAYQLTVDGNYLKGKRKKDVIGIVEEIARLVISNSVMSKNRLGIRSEIPIPWSFHPLEPQELDSSDSKVGVLVNIDLPIKSDEIFGIFGESSNAEAGYAEEFDRAAKGAAAKFEEYYNCRKILLVQFFGDDPLIMDEDIIQIIKSARLPNMINEVWLAQHDWISEDDYVVGWNRVQ